MKMSASEYNNLLTVRKLRRLIRNEVKRHRNGIFSSSRKIQGVRVRLIFKDANEGNILKTRRYKGRIKSKK